jgi:hypothetical protein
MQMTKKLPGSIFLNLTVVFFMLNGCASDKDDFTDFRNKYIGKYQVKEMQKNYREPDDDVYSFLRDTIISVNYGNSDSTVEVIGRDVKLNSKGYYSSSYFAMRIWNDSIYCFTIPFEGEDEDGRCEIYSGHRISKIP